MHTTFSKMIESYTLNFHILLNKLLFFFPAIQLRNSKKRIVNINLPDAITIFVNVSYTITLPSLH